MNFIKTRKEVLILISIVLLAAILRFYQLGLIPPSLTWDESSFGYNAWTIANYGRDEWGEFFPITFRSFNDYKHPVHIYILAIFVKLFGLNDLIVRLPFAIFGVANVFLLYFLAKQLFNRSIFALISAFFLATSPMSVHFSRFAHEANVTLFFYLLGLIFFLKALDKSGKYLILSFLFFGVSLISYQSAKIIILFTLIFLSLIYYKKILRSKINLLISLLVLALFLALHILDPQLLGLARAAQTGYSNSDLEKTEIYKGTKSLLLSRAYVVFNQYRSHFSLDYLFLKGNPNPRLAIQEGGEFLVMDGLFLVLGFIGIIFSKSKKLLFILFWAAIAPLPSSLVKEAPHAARAMFMMGSFHLIMGYGFLSLIDFFKRIRIKNLILLLIICVYLYSTFLTYSHYFKNFNKYAIDYQYGMRQIVEYVKERTGFTKVYVTDKRSQPYIFFLYNLQFPLNEYLKEVKFNTGEEKSYNLVYSFDRFIFKWDVVHSLPDDESLYILTPSEYDGLLLRKDFEVKKIILFPNGTDAFYIVSKKL